MTKPNVFIVAKGPHDYSKAADKGELTYLFPDNKVNVFASDQLASDVAAKLAGSTPDDFLILSGNMVAASIAFAVMLLKHGAVNVLIYSFKSDCYEVRTIRQGQCNLA